MISEVGKTPQVTCHQFHTIEFTETFERLPVLLADVQKAKGGNTLYVRWANKDVHCFEVNMIDEEQAHDTDPAESTGVVG